MSDVEFKRLAKNSPEVPIILILLLLVVTLILVVFVWAAVTEPITWSVFRKTISEAKNQLVQSSEPGVIRARYIEEGDIVKKDNCIRH